MHFFIFSTALVGRLCLMFCTPALKYEKYHKEPTFL